MKWHRSGGTEKRRRGRRAATRRAARPVNTRGRAGGERGARIRNAPHRRQGAGGGVWKNGGRGGAGGGRVEKRWACGAGGGVWKNGGRGRAGGGRVGKRWARGAGGGRVGKRWACGAGGEPLRVEQRGPSIPAAARAGKEALEYGTPTPAAGRGRGTCRKTVAARRGKRSPNTARPHRRQGAGGGRVGNGGRAARAGEEEAEYGTPPPAAGRGRGRVGKTVTAAARAGACGKTSCARLTGGGREAARRCRGRARSRGAGPRRAAPRRA